MRTGTAAGEAPSGRRLAAGVGFALLAIGLWGGWFVVTRRTVGAGGALGPADLVALRFGIGGLLLLPVLLLRLRGLDRRAFVDGAILYVAQGAPFALLISVALRYAPPATARRSRPARCRSLPPSSACWCWATGRAAWRWPASG